MNVGDLGCGLVANDGVASLDEGVKRVKSVKIARESKASRKFRPRSK